MSTILLAGATGLLGNAICQRLSAAGKSVRALVRESSDPFKVNKLRSIGAEVVQGDVRDRLSLDKVCQGVSAIICTISAMPFSYQPGVNDIQSTDLDGIINLIEAAQANHVSQFIYTSFVTNADINFPLQDAKREVERKLKESGLVYTILRPSYFMEVWLSPAVGFDPASAKAVIYGTGQNPISWISLQDVAQFAVASLDHPAAKNATLALGGPEAVSPLGVVKLFEQANGHSIELQFLPAEALEAQQAAATDPMQQSFSGIMRYYAIGDPIEMSATLQAFAIQPTTLKEYVNGILNLA
jgi:Predicted nucleoside-diphosphate-sugar epimerases